MSFFFLDKINYHGFFNLGYNPCSPLIKIALKWQLLRNTLREHMRRWTNEPFRHDQKKWLKQFLAKEVLGKPYLIIAFAPDNATLRLLVCYMHSKFITVSAFNRK